MAAASDRKMRGFKRWMNHHCIECSDALLLSTDDGGAGDTSRSMSISVKAVCDLKDGDIVVVIPKRSCLTLKTSAASQLIEEAQLGGKLGLCVALMYEKSLGAQSKWFPYLQILPPFEPIPLLWSLSEIDSLLCGTELHKIVKQDKALVYEDWKECIEPLLDLASFKLNPKYFTVEEYFSAKSLVASRSFQIDDYHGFGMVPLADLFNHKTAAEDIHFTSVSSDDEDDESTASDSHSEGGDSASGSHSEGGDSASGSHSEGGDFSGSDLDHSSSSGNESKCMEMVMVEDVKAGAEVFNTYGYLGNAALLHRYGFTEPDNPFDIVNIDLDIVIQWSSSLYSCRHCRRRLSFWRKEGYSGCVSQESEYFEISFDGEPQRELLELLDIMLLPEAKFNELDLSSSVEREIKETSSSHSLKKGNILSSEDLEPSKKLLLTQSVRQALSSLADARESLYGPNSLEEDIKSYNECSQATDPKLRHSLILRISERRIIEKLRCFAVSGAGISETAKGKTKRKRKDSM